MVVYYCRYDPDREVRMDRATAGCHLLKAEKELYKKGGRFIGVCFDCLKRNKGSDLIRQNTG